MSSSIGALAEAVKVRHGLAEDQRAVYLGMLPTIASVCRNLAYGSFEPAAVNAMTGHLAELLIGVARLYIPDSFPAPREDMPNLRPTAMDWALFAMDRGVEFTSRWERVPAARSVASRLLDMVYDTAEDYGVSFDAVVQLALRRVST